MKLSNILSMVMLAGAATVALAANDAFTGAANAAPAHQGIDRNPTNRLGAELAKDLDEGQKGVAGKARSLDMRERMLQAAATRMQVKAGAAPAAVPPSAAAQEEAVKAEADQSIMQLVKVYQSMKPKLAARVFERLDIDIQTAVASKMRTQAMAAMMGQMSPEGALRLTTALARPATLVGPRRSQTGSATPPAGMPIATR